MKWCFGRLRENLLSLCWWEASDNAKTDPIIIIIIKIIVIIIISSSNSCNSSNSSSSNIYEKDTELWKETHSL